MASYSQSVRSGLPRVPGGEPWPPAGVLAGTAPAAVPPAAVQPAAVQPAAEPQPGEAPRHAAAGAAVHPDTHAAAPAEVPAPAAAASTEAAAPATEAAAHAVASAPAAAVTASTVPLRRGLPRVPGGEAWPPAGFAPAGAVATTGAADSQANPAPAATPQAAAPSAPAPAASAQAPAADAHAEQALPAAAQAESAAPAAAAPIVFGATPLRRGLPRVAGGEPWPAEGFAPVAGGTAGATVGDAAGALTPAAQEQAPVVAAQAPVVEAPVAQAPLAGATAAAAAPAVSAAPAASAPAPAEVTAPATAPAATQPAAVAPAPAPPTAAQPAPKPAREPIMIGSRTLAQWVKLGSLGLVGLVALAGVVVLAARGVTTLPGVPEFVERHPGEYHPAVVAEEGFPAWARWTHFLNLFFMVLIVRTGLTVRHQQKPDAFYTPKRGGKKVSIHLWLHTSLDLLWLANGIVFVVLLFVTGHWARIVPTSWEVFPNAASAMLQYLTLDWPVENGWVNYNALQQLMYFIIVFIAAPVAAITGVRMSEWWPKNNATLDRVFPAPLARALHYPTMLFFVFFVIVHVFLVFTTGALRNLNHMYAGNDGAGWFGFWMFAAGLVAIVAAWLVTRPLLIAPVANLFGKVSNR